MAKSSETTEKVALGKNDQKKKQFNYGSRISTGISGLDEIMEGGLVPGRSYLLSGGPGSGKTTIGFHFLTANSDSGEKSLFISLSEEESQLRSDADTMGFNLKNLTFLDLSPSDKFFEENQAYDIFMPSEVEREPMTQSIIAEIKKIQPTRVFIDSMTQLRYLTPDAYQFRKQVLSFVRYMIERGITVIYSSEGTATYPDDDLQFMSDGMILLSNTEDSRTLEVRKFRGSNFRSGRHVMKINAGGVSVYPRLLPKANKDSFILDRINTGIPELDELFGGGLERSTTTIITGPSGVGKTTLGVQFMKEAAGRAENSAIYSFEESPETIMTRCESIKMPVRRMVERGTLFIDHVEPLLYTPDEFAYKIRGDIESKGIRIVMIDSVSGYKLSMRGIDVNAHLHALCKFLTNTGITVILNNEIEAITGEFRATDLGISYLADNIIYLRYLEVRGQMKKAIGVLKKRMGDFEKNMREFDITQYGIKVGKPLTSLRNILSGIPEIIQRPVNDANQE